MAQQISAAEQAFIDGLLETEDIQNLVGGATIHQNGSATPADAIVQRPKTGVQSTPVAKVGQSIVRVIADRIEEGQRTILDEMAVLREQMSVVQQRLEPTDDELRRARMLIQYCARRRVLWLVMNEPAAKAAITAAVTELASIRSQQEQRRAVEAVLDHLVKKGVAVDALDSDRADRSFVDGTLARSAQEARMSKDVSLADAGFTEREILHLAADRIYGVDQLIRDPNVKRFAHELWKKAVDFKNGKKPQSAAATAQPIPPAPVATPAPQPAPAPTPAAAPAAASPAPATTTPPPAVMPQTSEITQIPGVNPKEVELLASKGVTTLAMLALLRENVLAPDIKPGRMRKLIEHANKLTNPAPTT